MRADQTGKSEIIWVTIAIAIPVVAGVLGLLAQGHLYADGANYLLKLLDAKEFVHIAENRIFATYLTQTPFIIAIKQYAPTLGDLSTIYGFTLFSIPIAAYGCSLWLTRNDPVAFFLTVAVVSIVFFSTIFVIIGEFQLFYSLTWLYAIVLTTQERRSEWRGFLLLFSAFVTIKCYEATAATAPMLILMTLIAMRRSARVTEKAFCLLLVALLAASAFNGVKGYIYPRDPGNAGGFVESLLKIVEDGYLFLPIALLCVSGAAAFIRNSYVRSAIVIAAGALALVDIASRDISGYTDALVVGSPNTQRAQVLPFFLALLGLQFLNWQLGWGKRLTISRSPSLFPMLMPLVIGLAVYITDLNRWRDFLALTCAELQRPTGAAFYDLPVVKTFGWTWEMPTLSVLLRPAGSSALLRYPDYAGWYPFDPDSEQPDIDIFKRGSSICPRLSAGRSDGIRTGAQGP